MFPRVARLKSILQNFPCFSAAFQDLVGVAALARWPEVARNRARFACSQAGIDALCLWLASGPHEAVLDRRDGPHIGCCQPRWATRLVSLTDAWLPVKGDLS